MPATTEPTNNSYERGAKRVPRPHAAPRPAVQAFTSPNEPLLTSEQMADVLQVSVQTFRKLRSRLPHVQVGWRRRYLASLVIAHLAAHPAPPDADSTSTSTAGHDEPADSPPAKDCTPDDRPA